MSVIQGGNTIEGGGPRHFSQAGVPVGGTDEVQTITFGGEPIESATSTFRLAFMGWTTEPILWDSTDATLVARIDAALEALPNVGVGAIVTADATLTNGLGGATVTFSGARLKKLAVPLITVAENLLEMADPGDDAPTIVVTETTPGVSASFRDAAVGDHLTDVTNGVEYVNTGAVGAPTWTAVSVGAISQELLDFVAAIPATHIAATGAMANHTATTAIAGVYADLAAARTSVNALRTDAEVAFGELDARVETLSDKLDEIIAMLETVKITAVA